MLDSVIIDINHALSSYSLSSRDHAVHALPYCNVFFERKLLQLACFVVSRYVLI